MTTRSPLVCTTSVGRERPLGDLTAVLDHAAGGHGSVVLLGGTAGVGKSRLIRDLKQTATTRGIRTVEGRCSSAESSVPYAPFMDALRFRIARGEGEAVARVLGPLREVLAPIFPELPGTESHIDRTPDRPFELIFSVLERLAGDDPMLLVLEDVHWADQTSLELLQRIAHRASSLRLLLVATYRSDELHASHPLRRVLASFVRDRTGEIMTLGSLTRSETAEMLQCMLGTTPDDAFVSAIWSRAEGNPFFIEEILTSLAEDGPIQPTAQTAKALEKARLPATVSEVVMERVHAMGTRALETLSVAAVLGRSVEFDVIREVLGIPEEELLGIVEQLVGHQLLREDHSSGRDHYSFPHALMQEALYESIISRRRRLLHRQVAEVLDKRPAPRTPTDLDRLAHHFRLGGDQEKAYAYSLAAGEEAVRLRAWDDAQYYHECALESLEVLKDNGTRSSALLEKLADVAWRRGRAVTARQYVEEALRLRRMLNQKEDTARLLRRLAALQLDEGEDDNAAKVLDEALQLLSKTPESPELGAVFDDLGRLSLSSGDLNAAESLLRHGLAKQTAQSSGPEEVRALVGLAEIEILKGNTPAGIATLEVAFEILREETLPFDRAIGVYAGGVRAQMLARQYDRAIVWAEAAAKLCEEQGVASLESLFRSHRAAALTITGSQEDTLGQATSAVAILRAAGRPELRDALRVLGFIHRVRGSLELARQSYEEAAALGDRGTVIGLALVALAEGRAKDAAGELEIAAMSVPKGQVVLARHLLPYVAEALIADERFDDASKLIESVKLAVTEGDHRAEVLFASGLLELATMRRDKGRKALSDAATQWKSIGNVVLAGSAETFLLEATFAAGEAEAGEKLGRHLLAAMTASGLLRERERVRRILRRAGIRTKSEAKEPAQGQITNGRTVLTAREDAVLREVAIGRTNREIANILGIAEKTVSVHVSHILAKLGCRTRTEAARFIPT